MRINPHRANSSVQESLHKLAPMDEPVEGVSLLSDPWNDFPGSRSPRVTEGPMPPGAVVVARGPGNGFPLAAPAAIGGLLSQPCR